MKSSNAIVAVAASALCSRDYDFQFPSSQIGRDRCHNYLTTGGLDSMVKSHSDVGSIGTKANQNPLSRGLSGQFVMAFVIRFATHAVEIWLKQQSPLRWGPLEDAQRYRTEADAHRAIASLWLRGVTIQDFGHLGNVVRFPAPKVGPRESCHDEAAGPFFAPEMRSIHWRPGDRAIVEG